MGSTSCFKLPGSFALLVGVCFNLNHCVAYLYASIVSCSALHGSRWRTSGGLIWIPSYEDVSGECIIIVPRLQLSDLLSTCYFICHVASLWSSQRCSLTIKASVASERSGKPPDFSHQHWASNSWWHPHAIERNSDQATRHSPPRGVWTAGHRQIFPSPFPLIRRKLIYKLYLMDIQYCWMP